MSQQAITIITDSTSDIPQQFREQYDIRVIPLYILFGEEVYKDGVDMQPEEFYERLQRDPIHPTTSQSTPADFVKMYKQAQQDGAEQILVMMISSQMSGTIESARQAAEQVDIPVHVYDSLSNSMGLGWQVLAAARTREKGGDLQSMLDAARYVRERVQYYISLDTLKYLSKGGRIGDAASYIGGLLNIKPQVFVNHQNGRVGAGLPSRTRKKAVLALFERFFKEVNPLPNQTLHIMVLHNAALDEAQQLAQKVKEAYNPAELLISIVSPVLGVHTGPKAIALCGYAEG